eukprot:scaffold149161_cov21-Tisochrysis_lutea.AAC.1
MAEVDGRKAFTSTGTASLAVHSQSIFTGLLYILWQQDPEETLLLAYIFHPWKLFFLVQYRTSSQACVVGMAYDRSATFE